jgi:AcrR family transcriptional regulator
VEDVNPRRSYHSPVRAESARRTQQAIVAAARTLFLERGYTAASLRDVAEVAGVARPTVAAAFGSKPALLRQILDEALAGDDEPVPVAERPWFAPVFQATEPRAVLDAYATVCVLINARCAALFEVAHRASGESPELAEMWATLVGSRRFGAGAIVEHARKLGPIRDDLDPEQVADALWTLTDPALYHALVLEKGWSEDDFRRWLTGQMHAAVLPPPA